MSILQRLSDLAFELYSDLVMYSALRDGGIYWLGLLVIGILGILTLFFSWRVGRGRLPILRGIPGVYELERNIEIAAEAGKTIHFSLGSGGLDDASTLQTLAGVDNLREISLRAALSGPPLISTTSSALALPVLESTVRGAYAEASAGRGYQAENNRFIAPSPVAYAAGAMRVLNSENVNFNIMLGSFGDEYLLIGETGARRKARQLVASADPAVLPFVVATADYPLIGEELFALSSYLRPLPARIASLISQDILRLVTITLILALVAATSLSPEFQSLIAGWTATLHSQTGASQP